MANFPPGERYVTAPVDKTVPVPLAPVVTSHSGADRGLIPASHPCKYETGPKPSAGLAPSPRKV